MRNTSSLTSRINYVENKDNVRIFKKIRFNFISITASTLFEKLTYSLGSLHNILISTIECCNVKFTTLIKRVINYHTIIVCFSTSSSTLEYNKAYFLN